MTDAAGSSRADGLIALATRLVTPEVAREMAAVYEDDRVFPDAVEIENPGQPERFFPGWEGAVLVLSHENQGVCSWGLALDGPRAGAVIVGGDLGESAVHATSLDDFVESRRWDRRCFDQVPLLQAQAAQLDERARDYLVDRLEPRVQTNGWPCPVNLRFEGGDVMVLLWSCEGQCDWWISGPAERLRGLLPDLRRLSSLATDLRSDDAEGRAVLAAV